MSANIYYRRLNKEDPSISVGAPSSFIESMERARLWSRPINAEAVPILRGMAAANTGLADAYEEVIEAIERYETIELYAKY